MIKYHYLVSKKKKSQEARDEKTPQKQKSNWIQRKNDNLFQLCCYLNTLLKELMLPGCVNTKQGR